DVVLAEGEDLGRVLLDQLVQPAQLADGAEQAPGHPPEELPPADGIFVLLGHGAGQRTRLRTGCPAYGGLADAGCISDPTFPAPAEGHSAAPPRPPPPAPGPVPPFTPGPPPPRLPLPPVVMPTHPRIAVFTDSQNCYGAARRAFHRPGASGRCGQFMPHRMAS